MKRYIFAYHDTTGAIANTWLFDMPEEMMTSQTGVMESSHQLYVIDITDQGMTEFLEIGKVKTDPMGHKIISGQIKRRDDLFPDAMTSESGFSPAATVANFQAGGTLATASSNDVATSCHVTMPTPEMNPTVGADLQSVDVNVGQFDTGQTGTPTVRIEVWENGGGSALATSSEINVTTADETANFTWNASVLGTADGSVLEIKVFGTQSGGAPSAKNSVNIGAIKWGALRGTNINAYLSPDPVAIPTALPDPVVTGGA
jgi:hypothetical protein